MQEKDEDLLSQLPDELLEMVTNYLPTSAKLNLSEASSRYRCFFAPHLPKLQKELNEFLQHVVCGEYDEVKQILDQDINILTRKEEVTDCSNRTFKCISGFQLALYYLDKHMWTKMLDCVPEGDEGKAVLKQLYFQYHQVKTEGVIYCLNGKKFRESHFDFENTIIKELQTQVNSINASGDKNWGAIDKQWREGVGSRKSFSYACCL